MTKEELAELAQTIDLRREALDQERELTVNNPNLPAISKIRDLRDIELRALGLDKVQEFLTKRFGESEDHSRVPPKLETDQEEMHVET